MKKYTCALIVNLTYLDIKRRPCRTWCAQSLSKKFRHDAIVPLWRHCNEKLNTWHTFWTWLRCANLKWIWLVLWEIQSGHDLVYRRTDGQGTIRTPLLNFFGVGYNSACHKTDVAVCQPAVKYLLCSIHQFIKEQCFHQSGRDTTPMAVTPPGAWLPRA